MPDGAILDNDILIKVSCYSIAQEVTDVLASLGGGSVLGVARFATPNQVLRSRKISDRAAAGAELGRLLAGLATIEPTQEETELAARFERQALEEGWPLDSGEGQILAIIVTRAGTLMVTGDKRAIASAEVVLSGTGHAGSCDFRVACFEQVMMSVLGRRGAEELRRRVCLEQAVDTAMAIIFSCHGDALREEDAIAGLGSYIEHLRGSCAAVLYPGTTLSVVP